MFTINVSFVDCLGAYSEKTEITDNWNQALNAYTIYILDPDCTYCDITYKDKFGEIRTAARFKGVEM